MSYILIFLLSPQDITDYTIIDTEYYRETKNRLLTKTAYDYNSKESINSFPKDLGNWKGFDYKYKDRIYQKLNADILLSRAYNTQNKEIVWMDIINSKTGESFHKQKICVEGQGWNVDRESITEFKIGHGNNPFTKFYANRLDISKNDVKQVMIYWFMFKKFGGNRDTVTMIRISSPAINNTEETFNSMKNFVETQLFDEMYKQADIKTITMAEDIVNKYGNKGLFAIIVTMIIPLGITLVGILRKG